jgi:serine/threonine-protein kinase
MTIERLRASLADRYRIERELGAGGMATVYLAYDVRHDRRVALKVLRPELAAVIGAQRFLAEIRTTANLQHPHILSLFDSGEADGTVFYVMPYVEGESLRDRLSREKQLPVDAAIRIATEVADALEYAHQQGVVHRDIKPENILLHGGHALVADFGIALAAVKTGGTRMTETGMSLGTPAYMSPEQAMGEREITPRSDVYALGCITYEMLVGDPPFTGSTAQAIVAKVLTEKPQPPTKVRDTVPDAVEDAVLTALAKLPADRFASAAEFSRALAGHADPGASRLRATRAAPSRTDHRRPATGLSLAFAVVFGVAAIWGWSRRPGSSDAPVVRFELRAGAEGVALPFSDVATGVAISPDGRLLAYLGGPSTNWMIYLRGVDQLTARALPGTEGALNQEFSPDGRWIAFRAPDGKLKKISVDGGAIATLCAIDNSGTVGAGIAWLSSREIIFARGTYSEGRGFWKVSSDGGEPTPFSAVDSTTGERLQLSPVVADGGRLVFYSSTVASNIDLNIGVIPTATGKPLVFPTLKGIRAVGLVRGYLVYVRGDGALMAAPFNRSTLTVGSPIQVGDSVAVAPSAWESPVALSPSGSLFYQRGGAVGQFVTVDLHGVARPLLDEAGVFLHPRLSPDGRRLAYEVQGGAGSDIWVADLARHTRERLTHEGFNNRPEWSPDGSRVLYTSSRAPDNSLWWQPADGSADATLLYHGAKPIREGVFTPDGRAVIFRWDTQDRNRDILSLQLGGDLKPQPLVATVDDEKEPRVSPDSKWLAYMSNENGREEVYVRALSGTSERILVSDGGGTEPLWSRDSRTLYYRQGPRLYAVPVTGTPTLAVGARALAFAGPFATDEYHPDYDVTPDGKGFVMILPAAGDRQLLVAINWAQELKARAGSR